MASYECGKGFLLTLNSDGERVPFFLKVRSEDIVWGDTSSLPENISSVTNVTNVTYSVPTSVVKFQSKGWDCVVDTDSIAEYHKSIAVGVDGFSINENGTELSITMQLPAILKNDEKFNVQCTMAGVNEELATSHVNVTLSDPTASLVGSITITLINNVIGFDDTFANITEYINSNLYVNVIGTVYQ